MTLLSKLGKKEASPLLSLPFKVFIFPSFHFGVHTLSPLSHPVTDASKVKSIQKYVQEELSKSGVNGMCDEKVKDVARFYFPGPDVDDPSSWVLENDAPVLDVDAIIGLNKPQQDVRREVNRGRERPKKPGIYESRTYRESHNAWVQK
ncbi:MAG: hypothetical protein IKT06_02170 [Aeriscardovia sp.]|nr:hypothetical protein [Aeriscardovia sp.]